MADLQSMIDRASMIVFFGGAGVSTESGIPDFRSRDGLYHMKYRFPPEEILSHDFFFRDTEEFYRFYRDKLIGYQAEPNAAHRKLAELEAAGKLTAVITQNIDGLHQAAGSKRVWELHGSVLRNTCLRCGKKHGLEEIRASEGVPRCVCGGIIKPDVVLYGESLDDEVVSGAIHALRNADLLIVAGTSLVVYPAAGLIRYYRGEEIAVINLDPIPVPGDAVFFRGRVGEILGKIKV
ncbi:MAG: NAD-dependent protein deacylase [Clostridia bacterium]|nr:NAD-dependent protein deacylase [Clostridia bacterium]